MFVVLNCRKLMDQVQQQKVCVCIIFTAIIDYNAKNCRQAVFLGLLMLENRLVKKINKSNTCVEVSVQTN